MSQQRSLARKKAVQALYMWQMAGDDLGDIDQEFVLEHDMGKVDLEYFKELLHQVPAHLDELDGQIEPVLDRPLKEIDPIELAIMRLGSYELLFRPDVPYKVIINEAVNLTKTFGADKAYKYVNSILDRVAKTTRAEEIKTARDTVTP